MESTKKCKIGEVYYCIIPAYHPGRSKEFIIQCDYIEDEDRIQGRSITCFENTQETFEESCLFISTCEDRMSRPATKKERQWLLACIKAGKLVKKPKQIFETY